MYKKVLLINKAYYGEEHVETAKTRHNLALALKSSGDLQAAKTLFEEVLAINKAHYGDEHVKTAIVMNSFAGALLQLDDASAAKVLFEKVLSIFTVNYGDEHVMTVRTMGNLGNALLQLGDASAAKVFFEKELMAYEVACGEQDSRVVGIHLKLAQVERKLSNPAKAYNHLQKAYALLANHPDYGLNHTSTQSIKMEMIRVVMEQYKVVPILSVVIGVICGFGINYCLGGFWVTALSTVLMASTLVNRAVPKAVISPWFILGLAMLLPTVLAEEVDLSHQATQAMGENIDIIYTQVMLSIFLHFMLKDAMLAQCHSINDVIPYEDIELPQQAHPNFYQTWVRSHETESMLENHRAYAKPDISTLGAFNS